MDKANVFTCSGPYHTRLPQQTPNYTDWLVFEKTNITELWGTYSYFDKPSNISSVSLTSGNLSRISSDTLSQILIKSSVKRLNITNNRLSEFPKALALKGNNLNELWLSKNPLECNCEMTWLINWLANGGKYVVKDYQDVICAQGMQIEEPTYLVKPLDMGCYPWNQNLLITMGVLGGVISFMILALVPIIHYTDIRWLVYRNFSKLVGDPDKDEDIDVMVFDAFVSFR